MGNKEVRTGINITTTRRTRMRMRMRMRMMMMMMMMMMMLTMMMMMMMMMMMLNNRRKISAANNITSSEILPSLRISSLQAPFQGIAHPGPVDFHEDFTWNLLYSPCFGLHPGHVKVVYMCMYIVSSTADACGYVYIHEYTSISSILRVCELLKPLQWPTKQDKKHHFFLLIFPNTTQKNIHQHNQLHPNR